jgi:hypothetical protein
LADDYWVAIREMPCYIRLVGIWSQMPETRRVHRPTSRAVADVRTCRRNEVNQVACPRIILDPEIDTDNSRDLHCYAFDLFNSAGFE